VSFKTRVVRIDPDEPDSVAIAEAAAILRAGGLVAFPTETVYGLGADATNPEAVARIFEAKGRPATNPLIVHASDASGARRCVADWPDRAEILAARYWPGPLTLVLPRSPDIPDIVTAGQATVGVRVPRPKAARVLIDFAGRPIAAPSANRSTGISPTRAEHVLKDLDGKIDLILDSRSFATVGLESTVLDLTGKVPRVLRPGTITREEIAATLGEPVEGSDAASPRSPGQMSVHYAPRVPTYRIERHEFVAHPTGGSYVLISIGPTVKPWPRGSFRPVGHIRLKTPGMANGWFYFYLHTYDRIGKYDRLVDFIVIIPPPDEPRWRAIRDRIWRASVPWPGHFSRPPRGEETPV